MTRRPLRAAAVGLALVLVAMAIPASPALADDPYVPISGTGSTWSQNALDQWRVNVSKNYAMTVNYGGTGSSAGRSDFINGQVDFAISEIPFQANPIDGSAPEVPSRGYAYMPIVAGGTSFMYNLKIGGKQVTNLRLSGEVITKIFLGQIRNWNDAAIKADNPGLTLPDKPITPIVRSDGSGSSAQFTLWMSKQYPSLWTSGMTSQLKPPSNGKAQNGSLGVAGYVSQSYGEGSITYVEYSYALKSGFPVAKVLNRAGYYIEPTANSVAVAMLRAQINSDLTQNLDGVYNSDDARAYPLSSYSYIIVPTKTESPFNEQKGRTLGAFLRYVLCEGQQRTPELGYSPLPMNLVLAGSDEIKRIPGAGGAGVDTANCNNPTFKPGDSPSNNQLAVSAAQPAACDKQGPTQCETGTAGAKAPTATTGGAAAGGSGGSAGAAGSTGTGAAAGAAGTVDTTTAGADAVYDETGALISDGSVTAGGAAATPFTAADPGMGPAQWMMLAAGLILIAVIVAPALFGKRRAARGGGPQGPVPPG